jgi:hypothetical protein
VHQLTFEIAFVPQALIDDQLTTLSILIYRWLRQIREFAAKDPPAANDTMLDHLDRSVSEFLHTLVVESRSRLDVIDQVAAVENIADLGWDPE